MKITEQSKSGKTFISSDLAIVSAISIFFPIDSINKENPNKAQFVFRRSKKLEELIKRYWGRELLVEPRQYFDQLKAIKARLYGNE